MTNKCIGVSIWAVLASVIHYFLPIEGLTTSEWWTFLIISSFMILLLINEIEKRNAPDYYYCEICKKCFSPNNWMHSCLTREEID